MSSFVRGESMLFVISSEPYMRLWVYYTTDYYICYLYMIFLSIHLCFVFCYYRISFYTKNQTQNTLHWTHYRGVQIFFWWPSAGLTNHPTVRDSNPATPLPAPNTFHIVSILYIFIYLRIRIFNANPMVLFSL